MPNSLKVTYELNQIQRAILAGLHMVSTSPMLLEDVGLLARLIVFSDLRYAAVIDAIFSERAKVYAEYSSLASSQAVEDAVDALRAVGLVTTTYVDAGTWEYRWEHKDASKSFLSLFRKAKAPLDTDRSGRGVVITDDGRRIALAILDGRDLHLRPPAEHRNTVFVACAFDQSEIDELFEREFVPASKYVGLKAVRVDRAEPARTITEQILQEIQPCQILLADLTFARPSVYFEVGLAQGLGIPVLLTCREDHLEAIAEEPNRIHFNLKQYKISFWHTAADGRYAWRRHMHPRERLTNLRKGRPHGTSR